MARRFDFSSIAKTVAASGTVTFTPSEIPSDRIVAFHLWGYTATTGNAFDTVDRIRVKANGVTRWDVAGSHFANFYEKFSWSNKLFGSGNQAWTIPFWNMLDHNLDSADEYQFEPGVNISLEVSFTSSAAAGSIFCGWTQTNVAPRYYTKLIGQQMNIANGAVNARFNLSEAGEIMGLGIPKLGLTRLRCVLNGDQWLNMAGDDYVTTGATVRQGLMAETQSYMSGLAVTETVPTNYFHSFNGRVPASNGQSYLEIDTNGSASWAGTANEVSIYSAVPV